MAKSEVAERLTSQTTQRANVTQNIRRRVLKIDSPSDGSAGLIGKYCRGIGLKDERPIVRDNEANVNLSWHRDFGNLLSRPESSGRTGLIPT